MAFAREFKLSFCVLLFNVTFAAGILDKLWPRLSENVRNPMEELDRITGQVDDISNMWNRVNSTQIVLATGMQELGMNMQHQMTALNNFTQQLMDMHRKLLGLNPRQERKCPDGFKKFNNSCFFFGVLPVNRMKAKRSCEQMSSYLVEVDNYAEDQFLFQELFALRLGGRPHAGGYYIGGTDREREGHWIWETSGRPINYTNWAEGKGGVKQRNGEDYIAYFTYPRFWADVTDGNNLGFICEYDL